MGVNNGIPPAIWTWNSLLDLGNAINSNNVVILLERKGKTSSGRHTRHININTLLELSGSESGKSKWITSPCWGYSLLETFYQTIAGKYVQEVWRNNLQHSWQSPTCSLHKNWIPGRCGGKQIRGQCSPGIGDSTIWSYLSFVTDRSILMMQKAITSMLVLVKSGQQGVSCSVLSRCCLSQNLISMFIMITLYLTSFIHLSSDRHR